MSTSARFSSDCLMQKKWGCGGTIALEYLAARHHLIFTPTASKWRLLSNSPLVLLRFSFSVPSAILYWNKAILSVNDKKARRRLTSNKLMKNAWIHEKSWYEIIIADIHFDQYLIRVHIKLLLWVRGIVRLRKFLTELSLFLGLIASAY